MKTRPYDRRIIKKRNEAFENTAKTVAPVAKDTNKTRRKNTIKPLANAIPKKKAPRKMR